MLDPQDEAYDRRLAHHLVALYYQSEEQIEEEFLDMAVLKDYIAYARTYINPRLNEEAGQALIEVFYYQQFLPLVGVSQLWNYWHSW